MLEDGSRRLVIGEQREDFSLCGRPAVLSPKMLDASALTLRPAKVQRLSIEERSRARRVTADRVAEAPETEKLPSLLRATGASSAVGSPSALTDADPQTTWAEDRGGAGKGEFVVMNAPAGLPLTAIDIIVRPPRGELEHAVAPRKFWLAADQNANPSLVEVTMPEDAWKKPGARYRVELNPPLTTDCLALVVDSAVNEDREARVTFAEVIPRTELQGKSTSELVMMLGGQHGPAAEAMLRAVGEPAYRAIDEAFNGLDEKAQAGALEVLDGAPCETSSPVYARALTGTSRSNALHALARIRRCGTAAAPSLEEELRRSSGANQSMLAIELAIVAPDRAIKTVTPLLGAGTAEQRRKLRVAVGQASRAPRTESSVRAVLRDASLPRPAELDLLRAIGDRLGEFQPEASAAFARLAVPGADFRTRYLLLGPAGALREAFLLRALLKDPSELVRAEAARVARTFSVYPSFVNLIRASRDPAPRVRQAVVELLVSALLKDRRPPTLAKEVDSSKFLVEALTERLKKDSWPFVRSEVASALSTVGKSRDIDQALNHALSDESPEVRASAARSLGERGATEYVPVLRARVEDKEESPLVRAEAARSLGLLCDAASLELLTVYARRLLEPLSTPELLPVAAAALDALGRIHPPDLQRRLAPLLSKTAPAPIQSAARAVLSSRGACGAARPR
jgi:HEAT repeat protein